MHCLDLICVYIIWRLFLRHENKVIQKLLNLLEPWEFEPRWILLKNVTNSLLKLICKSSMFIINSCKKLSYYYIKKISYYENFL